MTDRLILTHLEQMDKDLYQAIWTPEVAGMMVGTAQLLGAVFALVMVAGIAYKTMARHKPIDFLELGKPLFISLLLANWFVFSSAVFHLVRPVETAFKEGYATRVDEVDRLRVRRAALTEAFSDRLKDMRGSQETKQILEKDAGGTDAEPEAADRVGEEGEGSGMAEFFDRIFSMDWLIGNWMTNDALIADGLQAVIFWLGEVLWELSVYFIFLVRYICMAVLVIFGPVVMAASILPAFSSGWREWAGRAVSISFYGCVAYFFMSFLMVIIEYAIQADINLLTDNMATQEKFMAYVKITANNFLGTSGLYCIALYAGAAALMTVPEIATWVWPSSGVRGAGMFIAGMNESAKTVAMLAVAAVTGGAGAAAGAGGGGTASAGTGGGGAAAAAGSAAEGAAGAGGGLGSGPGMGGAGASPYLDGWADAGSPPGGAAAAAVSGEGHGTDSGPAAGGTDDEADSGKDRRKDAVSGRLMGLTVARQMLELYEQALDRGREDEFFRTLQAAGASRTDRHPGISRMEGMLGTLRGRTSAERAALAERLDEEIAAFMAGDGALQAETDRFSERLHRYGQADGGDSPFECRLAELAALLEGGTASKGARRFAALDALEARWLRSRKDAEARKELLDELDSLIARYGQGDAGT